ncbi:MAG: hypothetical protein M1814_006433 [Vezdaea aestivalis]|nr:MAG: hypothetical protein M1814_006433 [Vezdaea aestivalis]
MTSLAQILARLGLTQYLERLESEGFDSWETLLDIQESDFEALSIKLGHRRRIQREIATSRGLAAEAALPSSQKDSISEDRTPETDERGNLVNDSEDSRPGQIRTGKRKYVRHPKDLSFTEIAKLVGQRWQHLPPHEQEPFKRQADAAKERRRVLMEEYKKTEQYGDYEQYLVDFKAKNNPAAKSDLPVQEVKRPRLEHFPSTSSSSNTSNTNVGGYSPHSPSPATAVYLGRGRSDSSSSRQYPQTPRAKAQGVATPTGMALQSPVGGGSPIPPFPTINSASPVAENEGTYPDGRFSDMSNSRAPILPGWSRPVVPRGSLESVLRPPVRSMAAAPNDDPPPLLPPISATAQIARPRPPDKAPPLHPPLSSPIPTLSGVALESISGLRSGEMFPNIVPVSTPGPSGPWPGSPDIALPPPVVPIPEGGIRTVPPGGSAAGLGGMSGLSLLSRATDLRKNADRQEDGRPWPQNR